jgi:ATP-dependent Lon protease
MLPARNRKDLEDVPDSARKQVRFVWLEQVGDAIAEALVAATPSSEIATRTGSMERRAARSA